MEPREKWYQTVSSARLDTSQIEIPLYTALNKAKKVKYFDSNGILQVCTMEEGFGKIAGIEKRYNGELFVFLYERPIILLSASITPTAILVPPKSTPILYIIFTS